MGKAYLSSVPPAKVQVLGTSDDFVENQAVDVDCKISRVHPVEKVSVYWTKPPGQGKEEAELFDTDENGDGSYALTYTATLTFTRQDHN